MSFRVRLTLLFAGLTFLLFALVSLAVYAAFAGQSEAELDHKLVPRGESLASRIQITGDQASSPGGFGKGGMEGRIDIVYSSQGKVLLATPGTSVADLMPAASLLPQLEAGNVVLQDLRVTSDPALHVAYFPLLRDGQLAGILATAISREATDQALIDLRTTLWIANFVLLIMAGLVGWLLARRVLMPVERMRRLAEEISLQDLKKRIAPGGARDELSALAKTFDLMLERLDQAVTQDKVFFAESSHELRTPLTVIRGNIDLALQNPAASAEEMRRTLLLVREETDGMARIVNDLLFLARSDAQALEMIWQEIPLRSLVEEVAHLLTPLAREKGVELHVEGVESAVRGDRGLLQRLLLNLGENAIRYNKPGGWVRFVFAQEPQSALFMVEDNGLGIPALELPKLFTRFYRGVDAKRNEPRGTGLGLAIVAEIAHRHGGDVTVKSQPGQGSCFQVTIPSSTVSCLEGKVYQPYRGIPPNTNLGGPLQNLDAQPSIPADRRA
jgi:heavy metal sensor kinase